MNSKRLHLINHNPRLSLKNNKPIDDDIKDSVIIINENYKHLTRSMHKQVEKYKSELDYIKKRDEIIAEEEKNRIEFLKKEEALLKEKQLQTKKEEELKERNRLELLKLENEKETEKLAKEQREKYIKSLTDLIETQKTDINNIKNINKKEIETLKSKHMEELKNKDDKHSSDISNIKMYYENERKEQLELLKFKQQIQESRSLN